MQLTSGYQSLYILWVDGERLVEALECLNAVASFEVSYALVHMLECPLARLLSTQLRRIPLPRIVTCKKKIQYKAIFVENL
jgi:hypothetical protein